MEGSVDKYGNILTRFKRVKYQICEQYFKYGKSKLKTIDMNYVFAKKKTTKSFKLYMKNKKIKFRADTPDERDKIMLELSKIMGFSSLEELKTYYASTSKQNASLKVPSKDPSKKKITAFEIID